MTALIVATKVSYEVDGAALLRSIDLEVAPGELVAVIGPNGAGKSTLVGVLAGDLAATGGEVYVGGDNVNELAVGELAQLRAVLGQHRVENIPFTVADIVAMGVHPTGLGGSDASSAVAAAMTAMEVSGLANRVVASLSGGEHTRVQLARVLAQDTPLLILDEPLAALDVAHQERVMAQLQSIAAGGKGVLAVLHDLNAAAAYADRFVLMRDGAVEVDGPSAIVLDAAVLSDVYGHPMLVTRLGNRTVVFPASP